MKTNRSIIHWAALLSLAALNVQLTAAPMGTAFTYQGKLTSGTNAANGLYDFVFGVLNAPSGGLLQGSPVTLIAVPVTNGCFMVTLDVGNVFNGDARWLDIGVKTNNGSLYTELTPRQQLTPTPYSLFASNSATLGGQFPSYYAPASGSTAYVAKSGDTMTGTLNLPANGLVAGTSQLVLSGGKVGIGTAPPQESLDVNGNVRASGDLMARRLNVGMNQTLSGLWATIAGGQLNTASGTFSTVSGGNANTATGDGATVAGGGGNLAAGLYAFVGGYNNNVIGDYSAIGSGQGNQINSGYAAIASGVGNKIQSGAYYSFVGGGALNSASNPSATVGGGYVNAASGAYATVGGGATNTASGSEAFVGGGYANTASSLYATVSGGASNTASGSGAFVGGGGYDSYFGVANGNVASGSASTIGGGYGNKASGPRYATVGGGWNNTTADTATTVGGGSYNYATGTWATVSGGASNTASNTLATVSGGRNNIAGGPGSFVGGGGWDGTTVVGNTASGSASTVGGGLGNSAIGVTSAIGGGNGNQATGTAATIAGGFNNTASGNDAAIGGGDQNTASAFGAMVPGGWNNTAAGNQSFAAGTQAKASRNGAFVWADSLLKDYDPVIYSQPGGIENSFNVRAQGGVYFATAVNGTSGQPTAGMYLGAGGSGWNAYCDRNAKTNFQDLNGRDVLDRLMSIPIQAWNYKTQDESVRHLGPMAQDFNAAFGTGEADKVGEKKYINSVDADGVALAAIQGLNQKVEEKEARIRELENTVNELKAMVQTLAGKANGGAQ